MTRLALLSLEVNRIEECDLVICECLYDLEGLPLLKLYRCHREAGKFHILTMRHSDRLGKIHFDISLTVSQLCRSLNISEIQSNISGNRSRESHKDTLNLFIAEESVLLWDIESELMHQPVHLHSHYRMVIRIFNRRQRTVYHRSGNHYIRTSGHLAILYRRKIESDRCTAHSCRHRVTTIIGVIVLRHITSKNGSKETALSISSICIEYLIGEHICAI